MDLLLNNFISLIEGENGLFQTLLSILQKEKKAVVISDLKEINETTKEKESLFLKIRILEEERSRMLIRLANHLGYRSRDLTMSKISQLIEEPYSSRLKYCYSNLLSLVQSIQEINHNNRSLITHSLELVRGSLALLNNLASSNVIYYRSGRMQHSDQSGMVVSNEI